MYLTHRLAHPPRAVAEHEEIELLFESYLKQTSELLSRVSGLQSHKKATEQLTALFLDHQRNTLLRFDTQLNMGTLSLAIAAFGTGVFGMNLESGVESSPLGLWMVGVACTALGATAWLRLRRRMIEILKFGGR